MNVQNGSLACKYREYFLPVDAMKSILHLVMYSFSDSFHVETIWSVQVRWAGLKHTDATIVILLKYLNVFYFLTGPDFQYICESLLSSHLRVICLNMLDTFLIF